jgi:DNA adenine methylase
MLPEILRRLPKGFDDKTLLHEWFAGGAALFWHLTSPEKPQRAVLCDTNPAVTSLYQGLQNCSAANIYAELAEIHRREVDSGLLNGYNAARAEWNSREADICDERGTALVLYLNRRGFNGLWRVNARGEHNVPVGKWKGPPPALPSFQDLQAWKAALQFASIRKDATCWANEMPGAVVFADPPYLGGFVQYTQGGFPLAAQHRLVLDLLDAEEFGATVIATNSPEATQMYEANGFVVEPLFRKGSINSDTSARGDVKEIIIT